VNSSQPDGRLAVFSEVGRSRSWLNRSTLGISLASLFSDISHELATAALPSLLLSLGSGPAALGVIEGTADGVSALAKLGGGVAADRFRRKKPLASIGYLVTAIGIAAIGICTNWWQVLVCRLAAWFGRGSRSAPRDLLMVEASPAAHLGKAFGMERAGDAMGAVLGPLLAMILLASGITPAHVVRQSLLPGLLAFLSISILVVEIPRKAPLLRRSVFADVGGIGRPYRRFLGGIFLFGCGDFSRTLLILYATQHLTGTLFSWSSTTLAIGLYVVHNAVSAAAAFPLGAVADRFGRRRVLVAGYIFAAVATSAFAVLPPAPVALIVLFAASGVYIACEEVAEKTCAIGYLQGPVRGTGLGLLAAVNGVADIVASALVGSLWAAFPARPAIGFMVAAALQLAGSVIVGFARPGDPHLHVGASEIER